MIKSKVGLLLRKMMIGETMIKEFSTVGIGGPFFEKVYLKAGGLVIDVTDNQWMLGLEPLTFGIWTTDEDSRHALDRRTGTTIFFRRSVPDRPDDPGRGALAVAELIFFDRIDDERGTLFLLQVKTSSIYHINTLKAHLIYWKFYKKPEFSFMKLKAVATAYSYPRRVRIISFKMGDDYNYIFPMDLLGDIRQSGRYLLGMRHSNKVLTKILEVKKIVVAEVPAGFKTDIYKLGRNHSANPPSLSELPFGTVPTLKFGFSIPDWAESYKEVTIRETLNIGSHMLLMGEWTDDVILTLPTPRLHHIHFLHFLYQKNKTNSYQVV